MARWHSAFPRSQAVPRVPEEFLLTEPPGAYASLAARARNTSDSLLVALESLGLAASLAILIWIPDRLALALPFLTLAMFGLWGVVEHVRGNPRERVARPASAALAVLQVIAALIGTLAAAATLYAVVGRAIGTIIS